jgi:hypothetical protein
VRRPGESGGCTARAISQRDACNLRRTKARRLASGVPKERRLAGAGLAADDEHGALCAAHVREQPIERRELGRSARKRGQAIGRHPGASLRADP